MPDGASAGRWPGSMHVAGTLTADEWGLGTSIMKDENVAGDAAISCLKVQQQYIHRYVQDHGAVVATKRSPLFVAFGDGVVTQLDAGLILPNVGAATVTIDIEKNGTTILSATLELDNTNGVREMIAGSIDLDEDNYVAGDFFEIVVTAAAGGGTLGQGLFVRLVTREDPSP